MPIFAPFGFLKQKVEPISGFIFDTVPGFLGYSVRKLKSDATSAMRVERSSDSSQQDIGFDSNGDLDTSALTSFVGSGDGKIVTWYDQSGNSKDITLNSGAPRIVIGGTVQNSNGISGINFDGNDYLQRSAIGLNNAVAKTVYITYTPIQTTANQAGVIVGDLVENNTGTGTAWTITAEPALRCRSYVYVTTQGTNNTQSLLNIVQAGSSMSADFDMYLNGTSIAKESGGTGTLPGTTGNMIIGYSPNGNKYFNGNIQEWIIFDSALTTDRTTVEDDINNYYSIYADIDPDAQAFLTATGIADATIVSAINQLVLDAKSIGVWTKLIACYPFVGGTATTHKYNLVDPQDTNGAHRLTFVNGATHSSDGIVFNGSNQYGNMNFIPSTAYSVGGINDNHIFQSIYLNPGDNGANFGTQTSGNNEYFTGNSRNASNQLNGRNYGSTISSIANTDTRLVYGQNRNSSTSFDLIKNKAKTSVSSTTLVLPNDNLYLSAFNTGTGVSGHVNRGFNLLSIGAGLTDTEWDAWVDANDDFQTALSRN